MFVIWFVVGIVEDVCDVLFRFELFGGEMVVEEFLNGSGELLLNRLNKN